MKWIVLDRNLLRAFIKAYLCAADNEVTAVSFKIRLRKVNQETLPASSAVYLHISLPT
jgi:hypothetical protein